jgi:hypothetical protein
MFHFVLSSALFEKVAVEVVIVYSFFFKMMIALRSCVSARQYLNMSVMNRKSQ